tara:strand:+ start:85 stop:243 length:159 start_codon:yes stop_codon:yes gene_type:complete
LIFFSIDLIKQIKIFYGIIIAFLKNKFFKIKNSFDVQKVPMMMIKILNQWLI